MKVVVQRIRDFSGATLGHMFVEGKYMCTTLENEHREKKVAGETRIPAGVYNLGLRKIGTKNSQYKLKYPKSHLGMIEILNVPNFEAILIHIGNKKEDTDGCILVGETMDLELAIIGRSTPAYERMYLKIAKPLDAGQKVTIEIRDESFLKTV